MSCVCELKLVDGVSSVTLITAPCVYHREATTPEAFRLRVWIIDEGWTYNSYREDTGTSPSAGLKFVLSPWNSGQFTCDLTKYLEREQTAEVSVGVNLFADGALTNACGKFKFQRTDQLSPAELSKRMSSAVRSSLSQIQELADPAAYSDHVESELKIWLPQFSNPPLEPSAKFDAAVKEAVKGCNSNRSQQTMTVLQRTEEQARQAMEQVRVLTEHIKELEVEARRAQVRHQTEMAALRAQIQRAKTENKPADWSCTMCTFVNPNDNAKCSMCGAVRQAAGKDADHKHK